MSPIEKFIKKQLLNDKNFNGFILSAEQKKDGIHIGLDALCGIGEKGAEFLLTESGKTILLEEFVYEAEEMFNHAEIRKTEKPIVTLSMQISKLQKQLSAALTKENYELAKKIKTKIARLNEIK